MLLSSVAESMYWTGRYLERAQALARAVLGYERLSLDLPEASTLDLRPLLALSGAIAEPGATSASALKAVCLDPNNASSVLGAVERARENLRHCRASTPPEVWSVLNALHVELVNLAPDEAAPILEALDTVLEACRSIEGELSSSMTRDEAHSFLRLGVQLERSDMLARTLEALLSAIHPEGPRRTFDDVRWMGILQVLGAKAMYRRKHHSNVDLASALRFLILEPAFPRSVAHNLTAIDAELAGLPRPQVVRSAVAISKGRALALGNASKEDVGRRFGPFLASLGELHAALQDAYFPERPLSPAVPAAETPLQNPFEHLEQEHVTLEAMLTGLEDLAAFAASDHARAREELRSLLEWYSELWELGHHEKEESILTPVLVENGFDWFDGPLPTMRRAHRQEHYFVRVLTHLTTQTSPWSAEDVRRFADVTRELAQFLREHIRHERREVFSPASRLLSEEAKVKLSSAFAEFEARRAESLTNARARLAEWLRARSASPAESGETLVGATPPSHRRRAS